jgi:hypothetical protein
MNDPKHHLEPISLQVRDQETGSCIAWVTNHPDYEKLHPLYQMVEERTTMTSSVDFRLSPANPIGSYDVKTCTAQCNKGFVDIRVKTFTDDIRIEVTVGYTEHKDGMRKDLLAIQNRNGEFNPSADLAGTLFTEFAVCGN